MLQQQQQRSGLLLRSIMMITMMMMMMMMMMLIDVTNALSFVPMVTHDALRYQKVAPRSQHHYFTMKVSRPSGRNSGADSILSSTNHARILTSGKVGTKTFVDPCKVFIGNLPASATESHVREFLQEHLGHVLNVKSIKVIRDWKTNLSKQYGFVIFTDPMFATCAMTFLKRKTLMGNVVKLDQGKKKLDPNTLYITKNKKKQPPVDAEEAAIQAGLDEATDYDENDDDMVAAYDDAVEETEFVDDAVLFTEELDTEDDFEYDGVFEEEYPTEYEALTDEEKILNREQRREAASKKKKKKLPHKGFGEPQVTL